MAAFFEVSALSLIPEISSTEYELILNSSRQREVSQRLNKLSLAPQSQAKDKAEYELKTLDEDYTARKDSLSLTLELLKQQLDSFKEGAKEKNKKDGKGGW